MLSGAAAIARRGIVGAGPQQEAHQELEREVEEARGRSGGDELLVGVAIPGESARARQPERRLLLAVLREAVIDACFGKDGAREEALGWIAGDPGPYGRRGWTFTFCCEHARVDETWLRGCLRARLAAGVTDLSALRVSAIASETRSVERQASATRRAAWTPELRAAASARQTARARGAVMA